MIPRATGADAEDGISVAGRPAGTAAETAEAEADDPNARGGARGEEYPMTGDEEAREEAQDAIGELSGDVCWNSMKEL